MDMSIESGWKEVFDASTYPSVIVFNPHKRLRFTKSDDDSAANRGQIEKLIEKILGGDARYHLMILNH